MNPVFQLIRYRLAFLVALSICSIDAVAQMEFVANKGQWNAGIDFRGDFMSGSFFIHPDGFGVVMHQPEELDQLSELMHGHSHDGQPGATPSKVTLHSFVYRATLVGAQTVKPSPEKPFASYNNYFIGNDPTKWAGQVPLYGAVTYPNIYPNIDIRYYSDRGMLKYDFIVHPGANVSNIRLRYDGPKLTVKDRKLIIQTPVGDVTELEPFSYQYVNGSRQEVTCNYVLNGNEVLFQVKNYQPTETLVIDPTLIFCSFTGSTPDNWGYTATYGPDGSLFAGGIVFAASATASYPVSPGAYQTTYGGGEIEDNFAGYDIALFKFNPTGNSRVYATYLGGNGNEQPHSLVVDGQGNLIVAGRTFSANYPTTRPLIGTGGNYDIVITKFNAAGSALLGSIRIGGSGDDGVNVRPKYRGQKGATGLRRNYGDDARSEVILDASNNIILASCTQSSNFPTQGDLNGGFGGGEQDGVILKFNANLSSTIFATYFGGNGQDACFVTSIDPVSKDIFVAGGTGSNNLKGDTAGVIYPRYQGDLADGFITRIKPDGSAIVKTTYLGTNKIDIVYGLKFDKLGFPYVVGTSLGSWPVLNAAYVNAGSKQFISKLRPDLSRFVYSTVFGNGESSTSISPIAFLVDRCENVYVSGWGGGINAAQSYSAGTTNNLPELNPISGIPAADGQDFYFFVMERNAAGLLFGSHFGQRGGTGDHVDGGTSRFDPNGIIYQAMCANCANRNSGIQFPVTPGAWAMTNGSTACNQAVVKIKMDFAGVPSAVRASINNVNYDTTGCIPLLVNFADTLAKGQKYYWYFGDASPVQVTTAAQTSHTYTTVGNFRVMLITEDSSKCNIRDTSFVTIRAGNNEAVLDFRAVKDQPCTSLTYTFFNESTISSGNFSPRSFVWNFGDGSPNDTASFSPPVRHTFPSPGNYVITLQLLDTAACNAPLVLKDTLRVNPLVDASFRTNPVGCVPYAAVFENTSLAGLSFLWQFGDNTTSTDVNPTHVYNTPGDYRVRLIAYDSTTCNKVDTSDYFTIKVSPIPDAQFSWSPNPPEQNTATQFQNQSTGAIRYDWDFGDGGTSTQTNPRYQFNATDAYQVTLYAYNEYGCVDSAVQTVNAIVLPLLDVPNAFTPGRFGVNGIISVYGFGIGKMDWRIYNRWGQQVFHSTNKNDGWDGTFKGKQQAMDVYTYTLDVEFTDGKKLRKTGDITLLR